MLNLPQTLILLCSVLLLAGCEEWYMPDSNLISDQDYVAKVDKDRSCFKIVKYFTPNCPYCRYLKAVIDPLKHSRKWCFNIYDLNCQWYPQFCMNSVKATSFPYTAVYDQDGKLIEEFHGFYPEPIITEIFERVDKSCREAIDTKLQINTESIDATLKPAAKASSLSAEAHPEPVQGENQSGKKDQGRHKIEQKVETVGQLVGTVEPTEYKGEAMRQHQQAKLEDRQQETKRQEAKQVANQPQSVGAKVAHQTAQNSETNNAHRQEPLKMPAYVSYILYTTCTLVAAYYVYSLHSKPERQPQAPPPSASASTPQGVEDELVDQESDVLRRQSQLQQYEDESGLLEIPDDQL